MELQLLLSNEYKTLTKIIHHNANLFLPLECCRIIAELVVEQITVIPNIFDPTMNDNNNPSEMIKLFNQYWCPLEAAAINVWKGRILWDFGQFNHNKDNIAKVVINQRVGIQTKVPLLFFPKQNVDNNNVNADNTKDKSDIGDGHGTSNGNKENCKNINNDSINDNSNSINSMNPNRMRLKSLTLVLKMSMSFDGAGDFVVFSMNGHEHENVQKYQYGYVKSTTNCEFCHGWGVPRISIIKRKGNNSKVAMEQRIRKPKIGEIFDVSIQSKVDYNNVDQSKVSISIGKSSDCDSLNYFNRRKPKNDEADEANEDDEDNYHVEWIGDIERKDFETEYGHILIYNREQPGCSVSISKLSVELIVNQI